MEVRQYVDGLFARYPEETVADFKEEVCGNLQERIEYLVKKGATKEAAFNKATAELGDISEIADQISAEKRKEVISSMYMSTRSYMDKWHVIGYVVAGALLLFGLIFPLSSLLFSVSAGEAAARSNFSLALFVALPVVALTFLGLTQETAKSYPMGWQRALLFAVGAGLMLFGLLACLTSWWLGGPVYMIIRFLIPFVIPGAMLLGYLLLTQKSRHKPWVKEQAAAWEERMGDIFADPRDSMKFGLYSGALWIAALALFLILGFAISFMYSWLVFLLAVAVQLLIQAAMIKKR